ncbi:MAG: Hsp20/alpha crystallin family protein [Planctomycetaceae bacterium]|nr:Hsp20/alpha crystallin family protein [Planctomycetaceae bacterium]
MALGYRPRHPLHQLRDEMDRLLTGFFGPAAEGIMPAFRNQPAVNVWERDDVVMVEMEVPGVKSDQLDLSVAGAELSVRIERPDTVEEGTAYHRRERPVGPLTRVIHLPVEVDSNRVEAQLRDGVLTITLPKAESAKARKINVVGA